MLKMLDVSVDREFFDVEILLEKYEEMELFDVFYGEDRVIFILFFNNSNIFIFLLLI